MLFDVNTYQLHTPLVSVLYQLYIPGVYESPKGWQGASNFCGMPFEVLGIYKDLSLHGEYPLYIVTCGCMIIIVL